MPSAPSTTQTLEGLLLVDKPAGITSMEVDRQIKRSTGVARIGHLGTLDPLATGVLPIFLGRATRLIPYLEDGDKEYKAEITFGLETDSWDTEGQILKTGDGSVEREKLLELLSEFQGSVKQVPPSVSAKHYQGRRLYDLQREGKTIVRDPIEVVIQEIRLLDFEAGPPSKARLFVHCSKGTYIRSIAHELGQRLGCGAVQSQLQRVRSGPFQLDQCKTLTEILDTASRQNGLDSLIILFQDILPFPKVTFEEPFLSFVTSGKPVPIREKAVLRSYERAQLVDSHGNLAAVGWILPNGRFKPDRVFIHGS